MRAGKLIRRGSLVVAGSSSAIGVDLISLVRRFLQDAFVLLAPSQLSELPQNTSEHRQFTSLRCFECLAL